MFPLVIPVLWVRLLVGNGSISWRPFPRTSSNLSFQPSRPRSKPRLIFPEASSFYPSSSTCIGTITPYVPTCTYAFIALQSSNLQISRSFRRSFSHSDEVRGGEEGPSGDSLYLTGQGEKISHPRNSIPAHLVVCLVCSRAPPPS